MTVVDEDLEPVLVSCGNEDVDVIAVQTKVGNNRIRVINGYGPQEDEDKQQLLNFWHEIEKEVISAKDNGCMMIMEMDANAKVGREVIANDPHNQTNNGKILVDMVSRNNLVIANALDICKIEKSAIDYVIICRELYKYLIGMNIDEERFHVLTNYRRNKSTKKSITSDHNILYCNFSLSFSRHRGK